MKIYPLSSGNLYTGTPREYHGKIAPAGTTTVPPPEYCEGFARRFDPVKKTWMQVSLEYLVPATPPLKTAKAQKIGEFDALFSRLDTLKLRPAAAIAEAVAAAEPIPPGDAYRLSELEAVAAENRELRDMVVAAETVEAVQAVEVWWPGDGMG